MRLRWFLLITAFCVYLADTFEILTIPTRNISVWFKSANTDFPSLPAGIAGAILTATVAWIALRTNAAVNIRNKRMDVILHCNARYDELYRIRSELEREASHPARGHIVNSYFRRYWGLQSDQIDYWLAGYIDPETMSSWVVSLSDSMNGKYVGDENNNTPYRESWNYVKDSHKVVNERLRETVVFVRDVLSQVESSEDRYAVALHYLRIVESNERSLIKRLSRNLHHRMSVDDLATTIRASYWTRYNAFDRRYLPFRALYRLQARASRLLSAIPDWLQGNSLKRLTDSIELMPVDAVREVTSIISTPE